MAVLQLSYYSNTDTSIEDMQNTLDANFIGHHQVTLTEWGTDTVPQIAIGSVVENNGALFKFTANTSISGSPSDGTVYIYLVPSGDPAAGTATVTPTFTNTAPTWSDSKQGFYGTGGYSNYRYLEFKITKSSSSYSDKRTIVKNDYIDDINIKTAYIKEMTGVDIDITGSMTCHYFNASIVGLRVGTHEYFHGDSVTKDYLYDALEYDWDISGYIQVAGAIKGIYPSTDVIICGVMHRHDASTIRIYGLRATDGAPTHIDIVNGSSNTITYSFTI